MKKAKENTSLLAVLVVGLVLLVMADHYGLSHKWHTAIFGTAVPFWVVVVSYSLRWRRWSFWVAVAMCLMVHLVAMWVVFRYVFVNRAPGWLLWTPVVFVESFALLVAVRRLENRLLDKHPHTISL